MRWHKGRAGWRLQLVLLWATLATVGCQRDKPRDCGASSCYQVLGLGSKASDDDIKKAYRRLAKEWHPDKNPDKVEEAQAQFMEIGNAYEILSTERASYDNLLRYGGSPFGGGGGFGRQHNFYRGQQQQRWHRESAGGDGGGALMGLLVPLGILVYVLSSQFNGGGAAAAGGGAARGDRKQAGAESSEKEQEDERTPSNLLPKGTRVQVQGLQSAAAAALNGTRGGVVSYDATKGRYIVQLTAKAMNDHTSLAPKNVQQIVYGAVILRGFRSRPAAGAAGAEDGGSTSTMNLAGKSCRVVGSNVEGVSADSGGPDPGSVTSWEHLVELNDDKEGTPLEELTRLQPDAIKLPVGVRVTIVGLQSRPELNGGRVEILKWDDSTGRYVVQLEGTDAPMALRPRNCQV